MRPSDGPGPTNLPTSCQSIVRAYDAKPQFVKTESYSGTGSITAPRKLGEFALTAQQTGTSPLLVVAEVKKNGALADRTFYFVNYEAVKGSLFKLPRTTLALRSENGRARVTNAGSLRGVGVAVLQPGHLDTFTADANYFWLDPGESREIGVNSTAGLAVEAFNVDEAAITPTNPAGRASSGRLRSPASGR
jgi:beta-mannosidase